MIQNYNSTDFRVWYCWLYFKFTANGSRINKFCKNFTKCYIPNLRYIKLLGAKANGNRSAQELKTHVFLSGCPRII